MLLLDLLHLGLELAHLGHALIGLVGQGEHDQFDDHGQGQDGQTEIAQHAIEEVDDQEDRAGQEEQEAPVDRIDEARQAEAFLIAFQDFVALGAGEQMAGLGKLAARRNGHGLAQHIGLHGLDVALIAGPELGFDGLTLIGDQGRQPEFVGDAQPAAGRFLADRRLLGPVLVFVLFSDIAAALAEGADGALVRDHFPAQRRRYALAPNRAIGGNGDRLGAEVGHCVGDGEQILVVDRNHAGEAQPLAIVPGQGDGGRGRQGLARRQSPGGIQSGHAAGDIGSEPAELGEIGIFHPLRPEQLDRLVGAQGLVIAQQEKVIELSALKRERAAQPVGLDRDAAGIAQRGLAIGDEDGRRGRDVGGIGRQGHPGLAGLGHRLALGIQGRLALVRLGLEDKGLIGEQEDHRDHDEDDRVATVFAVHESAVLARCGGFQGSDEADGPAGASGRGGRGVASLVRAHFTSSSKRDQSRPAVPIRAIST